jgi:hypothetical protein
MAGSGDSSDIFTLVGTFPLHSSTFSLSVSSSGLGIGFILCGSVLDRSSHSSVGACITQKRVSFVTVLAESHRENFDWPVWSHSHDSFLNLGPITWSTADESKSPGACACLWRSEDGGKRGGVGLGFVHGTKWTEKDY